MDVVTRGGIYLVSLDPTMGSEIKKTRPCVVVSPPEIHDYLKTALVVPMTSGSRPTPFRVPVRFQNKNGLLLPEQIRAVDKVRLVKHLGQLEQDTADKLFAILREMFA
ncbi:type II toxin-antitoxin system PemK/MazF family toxin [Neisseria lisongii]|uniref:Type II toxin-antitoxin system PemK/MazF family toxin n=1 Tax=Neisseria lisongii TaxID=2912188 RepID=A0AAW5AM74_9NEIS|nr:type II toxin-antitoxin system PemK/MazF family toxin [Neisseria lisongii]MCF7529038.1 type II toxin-antitoxin system PemK/MazF family toxin [Neisseria lisongii]